MAKSKSSKQWLNEHFSDNFTRLSQKHGYRSRAIYKLAEINERDKIIKKDMNIIDLGATPGGWSQYVAEIMRGAGKIIALDLLPMDAIPDVAFIQGDFREDKCLKDLRLLIKNIDIDLVMSDMAPNLSGNRSVDQPRSMALAELVLALAIETLKPDGNLLIKVFEGDGLGQFRKTLAQHFKQIVSRKPGASRARSREYYILAKRFKG